jgi:hypothetical protein
MVKIKIECWWTDVSSIHNRFIRQFVPPSDLGNYSFVNEDQDFTIVLGRTEWDKITTPKDRTFYFSQEPLWSPNQPKDDIHNYCSKIFISDKRDYPDRDEYIETLLPMLYSGRGEMDNRKEWDWSYDIKNIRYSKSKPISIIVRKDYSSYYDRFVNPVTSKINYKPRTDLGIELSNNKDIDVFGTYWENNGENIKGEIWNKHIGLDDYRFSIGCENSIQKNYVSEKFWDIILTEGVPIYLGCTNIKDYVPSECFISLNDLSMFDMVSKIEFIQKHEMDIYNEKIKYVLELKDDFFRNPNYNLWERIKKEISE